MIPLEKKILNKLLDTYENSKLSRGENKVTVHISYAFTKKNIPEYFDESSMAYEEIHALTRELARKGFVSIVWKNNKEDHIIEKVLLREDAFLQVYQYVNRVPKMKQEESALWLLGRLQKKGLAPVTEAFVRRMQERMSEGKTVREYLDLAELNGVEKLVSALDLVERNKEDCFIREFSIRHFHDSKCFEMMVPKICKIMREEKPEYADLDNEEILSEYQIYHTPGYVYMKGSIGLTIPPHTMRADCFLQGFGFALNQQILQGLSLTGMDQIQAVYTIENLTTFFRFEKENSLVIYLGGYHNRIRRELLEKIYEAIPKADYYHFGDIDAGGFQIYDHLKEKTGIPFQRYRMDLQTLIQYEKYGRKLTENDRVRLEKLKKASQDEELNECVDYMLVHNVKLEQECVIEPCSSK